MNSIDTKNFGILSVKISRLFLASFLDTVIENLKTVFTAEI